MSNVLLTGGAGYIGSHVAVSLLQAGHSVVIADDFQNSTPAVLSRIEALGGKKVSLFRADVADEQALTEVFASSSIDAVIHLAGLKAVGESVREPLRYYQNNLGCTMNLLRVMKKFGVRRVVFSSSATVYGVPDTVPVSEEAPVGKCTNPYGWTKFFGEQIFSDACLAAGDLSVVLLRYFNPIGAHESGKIGEAPNGIPNNLMPYLLQVATGKRDCLHIFGDDYDTPDGTGVRDYIHVCDLADGHVAAVEFSAKESGCHIFNLGTGVGYSVLELVKAFEQVNGVKIPYVVDPRREGDVATSYSDPTKAKEILGWTAKRDLFDMCRDSWLWAKNNPNGYEE